MDYEIVEIIIDNGEKYRARVVINNETRETMFFKFDHSPSQEEVNSTVIAYLDQINNLGVL